MAPSIFVMKIAEKAQQRRLLKSPLLSFSSLAELLFSLT
jgi:hypothetical protein